MRVTKDRKKKKCRKFRLSSWISGSDLAGGLFELLLNILFDMFDGI
ncbi:MAG: hypothetical protein IJ496_00590 [Ruminococcus sp.]|nr:hypothetical protein [Ruminococcus sp.]